MTMWKRERNHFNYYVTNERKQPHIYVEALGAPSASTEKVLKNHGFKFDKKKASAKKIASIAQKENLKKLKRTCRKSFF